MEESRWAELDQFRLGASGKIGSLPYGKAEVPTG